MRISVLVVLAGCLTLLTGLAPLLHSQECKDEKEMVQVMVQDVAQTVGEVRKESQSSFDTKYHRKVCLNKLTFAVGAVGDAMQCLDKASQNASASADQKASVKSESEADAKLKDQLTHYRDTLKSTEDEKSAKALIATFDLSTAPSK